MQEAGKQSRAILSAESGPVFHFGFGTDWVPMLDSAPVTATLPHMSMITTTKPSCLPAPAPPGRAHTLYTRSRSSPRRRVRREPAPRSAGCDPICAF